MEKLRERIQCLKEKRPVYKEMLDFYQKVREEQEKIKPSLRIDPILLKKEWEDLLKKEGFPLLQKQDFPLDIEASITLFQSLCRIAKEANPLMSEQVGKIEGTGAGERLHLSELLKAGVREKTIEQSAEALGLDKNVFLFLIRSSTSPSIEEGMKQVSKELNSDSWGRGICPVCGSLPYLSFLGEEAGKRSLLCSFCGYPWRTERLFCPFCGNKNQATLQFIFAEGEESCRIDLCDQCHQYIKTIDLRVLQVSDPFLEDLATLHLDFLASKKGYHRPIPNAWTGR